jgi:hypothetical protein
MKLDNQGVSIDEQKLVNIQPSNGGSRA